MPRSYTNLIYHIVFSTKDRKPLITNKREERLYEYIGGIIRGLGGILLMINGVEDHVHILAKLRPDKAVSDALRDLKSNASGWMHDVFPDAKDSLGKMATERFPLARRRLNESKDTLLTKKYITVRSRLKMSLSSCYSFMRSNLIDGICGRNRLHRLRGLRSLWQPYHGLTPRGFMLIPATRA